MVVVVPKLLTMQNCLEFWWISLCLYIIVLYAIELLSALLGLIILWKLLQTAWPASRWK